MGLLDDAIREHLDLKRRRGADPTEIERAEREALGPVRRGPEVGGDDAPAASTAVEPEVAAPTAPAEQWEPFDEDVEPLPPEPEPEPEPGFPPPAADPQEPPAPQHLDQETEEYELEPEEEEGDDVLESTPEFLQDAPDHDRLWFEQRPPRDFDFDG